MKRIGDKREILKISEDYFRYMAKNYPVMCLSDEFYFFPRAKEAINYLDVLDSLAREKVKQDVSYVKALLNRVGLADQADSVLLRQSMSTFLREFGQNKIYQTDPTLYLKILALGIDRSRTRTGQIRRLLNEAKRNLKKIPSAYLETAIEMTDSIVSYFKNDILDRNTIESLQDFGRFLKAKSAHEVFTRDRSLLEGILKDSFSYKRSLEEIYEIALCEYEKTLEELRATAGNWKRVLPRYIIDAEDLLGLYSKEINRLKDFFKEKNIMTMPEMQDILVKETPEFLRPIRASASYSCPITSDMREPAFFYITVNTSINNEYIFLTAHETYPGHHLLDSVRRQLKNPILQQIESPLFYEGWSSYAERLVDELGYIKDPLQRLVGLKRQAWRAIRGMLDVGVRINKLELGDAENMLKELGYPARTVKSMLRHYVLTPGYQLCYTIGKFEIDRLKEKFAQRLGLKRFHDVLLGGGQIPFYLVEKRMEEACKKNS